MDKITFHGNVGKDPTYEEHDGRGMARFTVAVNHRAKNDKGEWDNVPEWRNITVFGKTAEYCRNYVRKGRTVLIDGVPSPRWYKNKLEETVACIDVLANTVELIGGQRAGAQTAEVQSASAPVDTGEPLPF